MDGDSVSKAQLLVSLHLWIPGARVLADQCPSVQAARPGRGFVPLLFSSPFSFFLSFFLHLFFFLSFFLFRATYTRSVVAYVEAVFKSG